MPRKQLDEQDNRKLSSRATRLWTGARGKRRERSTMGTIPRTTAIFTFIALLPSTSITSSPYSSVAAFLVTPSNTATLPVLSRPHCNTPSERVTPSALESAGMSASTSTSSLKGTASDGNSSSSSSLSSSSVLDVAIAKIGSTTSMVVAGTFFLALCYKRDALWVSFFLGAISNAIFSKVLKKLLNIERPQEESPADGTTIGIPEIDKPSDNGMPSSHAMSLGFICTFVALLFPITTIPLLAYASISLIYRVRVNLHTVDQIAVGAILGILDGAVWWTLCTNGFRGFNVVESVSSSGIFNEYGQLHWYLMSLPLLVGASVVGSLERRLGKLWKKKQE